MLLTVGADGLTLKRTCRFAYGSTMGHGHARSRITRDVGIVLAVASRPCVARNGPHRPSVTHVRTVAGTFSFICTLLSSCPTAYRKPVRSAHA